MAGEGKGGERIFMPIVLKLYDPVSFDVRRTIACPSIPWRLFKRATKLARQLNGIGWGNLLEEHRVGITSLVMDLFHGQVGYDELMSGCTTSEMKIIIQEVINWTRVTPSEPNPEVEGDEPSPQPRAEEDDWMVELEIALVRMFHWSLWDIDETDIESLKTFIDRLNCGDDETETINTDKVSWI